MISVDKYQVYALYTILKKIWNLKRFNTITVKDFLEKELNEYIIELYIHDSKGSEYLSNHFINLINEFNCNMFDIYHWIMYVLIKALKDNKFPIPKDINSINKLKDYTIFLKRKSIITQSEYIKGKVNEINKNLNALTEDKFSLYDLNDKQENNAYLMFKNNEIDPEFYIRGLINKKFIINESKIKDIIYLRFITFSKMIIKLNNEFIKNNNKK